MTIQDTIAELRKLHEAAEPGPWTYGKRGTVDAGGVPILREDASCAAYDPNAALTVAMHTALPAILDRLEKLEEMFGCPECDMALCRMHMPMREDDT